MLNSPFTPIVSGNELYLAKKDTGLLCLNLKDRMMLWQRPSIQTILQPCIYGKHIFVASGKSIVAVDRKTGAALYKTKAFADTIMTVPFVQDNHLIVMSQNRLYQLSLATGEIVTERQVVGAQQVFPYQSGLGVIRSDRVELGML